jgi:RimJ/RimL family protein N-acetyltransferase
VIRELRDDDLPAAVALLRRLEPFWPHTEESLRDDSERHPAEAERRVWVADGGYAFARRLWEQQPPGAAMAWVGVVPERRRQGLGTALLQVALRHVAGIDGVERVQTWAGEDGAGFLERRGWRRRRERVISAVESAPPAIAPPEGIAVVPLRGVDPRALYTLDQSCSEDEPGVDIVWSFEEFERGELRRPLLDRDGSFVALAGGRPVAMSMIYRHGAVAHNGFTCTHPDWRGRGLATLVKTAALRFAFEGGVERVATMNDSENPPMLRVNERLGYRPLRTEHQLELALTERTIGVPSSQSTTLTEQ